MRCIRPFRRGGIGQRRRRLGGADRLPRAPWSTEWTEPDESIWEVRSGRKHFTYSKVMAWVAFDRAIKSAEEYGLDGPLDRWRELRTQDPPGCLPEAASIPSIGQSFVQCYDSKELDASLLLLPSWSASCRRRIRG